MTIAHAQKALDSWARSAGYADYDTYIRAGGSLAETARDITRRIGRLKAALAALQFGPEDEPPSKAEPMAKPPPPELPGNFHTVEDEPPDPKNAHIQGAEFGEL